MLLFYGTNFFQRITTMKHKADGVFEVSHFLCIISLFRILLLSNASGIFLSRNAQPRTKTIMCVTFLFAPSSLHFTYLVLSTCRIHESFKKLCKKRHISVIVLANQMNPWRHCTCLKHRYLHVLLWNSVFWHKPTILAKKWKHNSFTLLILFLSVCVWLKIETSLLYRSFSPWINLNRHVTKFPFLFVHKINSINSHTCHRSHYHQSDTFSHLPITKTIISTLEN